MNKYKLPPNFFINILHVLTILLLIALLMVTYQFTKDIVFNKGSQQIRNIPIYVQPYKTSLLKDKLPGSLSRYNFPQDELNISRGFLKIKYNYQNKTYKTVHVFYVTLQILISFGVILLIRRILGSVTNKIPFSYNNVRYLHTLSGLFVVNFVINLINTYYLHWHIKANMPLVDGKYISKIFTWTEPHKYSIGPNEVLLGNFQSYSWLIFALFIFAIAQIFKEGMRLKHDNESIL